MSNLIRGTYYITRARGKTTEVRALILRRRLQLLVHSYLYYEKDTSLVSDDTWSKWAQELYSLQKAYPHIANKVDYHKEFKNFDPSTGYDLPYNRPEISRKADYLLEMERRQKNGKESRSKKHRKRKAKG